MDEPMALTILQGEPTTSSLIEPSSSGSSSPILLPIETWLSLSSRPTQFHIQLQMTFTKNLVTHRSKVHWTRSVLYFLSQNDAVCF
jgi:hypothetical protein